jgi:hypothetical protein
MPRLSKIGAAALGAFGWTGLSSVSATYLQVAGGGGGSGGSGGGGGGAGGYLTGTTTLNPTQSYTVTVGAGGIGGTSSAGSLGTNGSNSQFGTLTASVGGGTGGSFAGTTSGATGGSGGGGSYQSGTGGAGTSGQGNAGGSASSGGTRSAGAGGGAGAVGGNGVGNVSGGAGGVGLASSISGTSTYYAGGGGGSSETVSGGTGGNGGGGTGATNTVSNGTSGTSNTGGGGGGGYSTYLAGNGGSGIVIISYVGAQQFGGGVVTSSGGNTIHTFNTSGTLSPLSSLTASYLIVAGGGGGGLGRGGGGGAGGLLSGSGVTIDTNSNYLVTVGSGGTGSTSSSSAGSSGSNSAFSMVTTTAVGGGGGGSAAAGPGVTGGSGGGAGGAASGNTGASGTSGQGNAGGNSVVNNAGGGGGGSSSVGVAGSVAVGGNGGNGTSSSISGSSASYAGGGGGGAGGTGSPTAGTGQAGGGNGGGSTGNGSNATANTGSGGGGGGDVAPRDGGNGGSGVVIISYAGATQQMAGGTVTISGGNVIHTFTSSGYLTPLKLVGNSLRFRSSASAYLNRTAGTSTNQSIATWSFWLKRGTLGTAQRLFEGYTGNSDTGNAEIEIQSDNTLLIGGYSTNWLQTTQVFRDPAAWYHIVVAFDTTQATSSNRIKLYVNGSQVTAFSTAAYPSQNSTFGLNNNSTALQIGRRRLSANNDNFVDGYLTEINFIDGQQLTPNSFGTFNSYGVWQPITYGGSYGTNGFYLPFTNKTSTTTLGYDFSPAGNNWTPNNISLTTGSTYDSMTDVPTLTSATAANYPTLNPLNASTTAAANNANLQAYSTSGANTGAAGINCTMAFPTTGLYYFEVTMSAVSNAGLAGIAKLGATQDTNFGAGAYANIYAYTNTSGVAYANNATAYTGSTLTTGDILGVAVDMTNGALYFAKNNTWQNSGVPTSGASKTGAISFTVTNDLLPTCYAWKNSGADALSINFGQRPFTYTAPTGYVNLNAWNL